MRRRISCYKSGDLPIIIIARDLPGKGIGTDDLPLIFTGIIVSCPFRII
jgi:hypothetical protein